MKYLLVFGMLAVGGIASAQSADVALDYGSASTNPNGNWTYGYYPSSLASGFTALTIRHVPGDIYWQAPQSASQSGTPAAWLHSGATSFGIADGQFALHPGPVEIAVARFTVPAGWGAGTANINGSFGVGDSGSVNGHVLVNGTELFSANVGGLGAAAFSLSNIALNVGDTVDFAVDNDGNYLFDSTPLDARLTYSPVPEPASFAAVSLGIIGLVARRRRRS